MLGGVGRLGDLFGQKEGHPLLQPRQLQQVIDELPRDNAFKALDEIAGWLESLLALPDCPADRLHEAACRLEDAAGPHLKRLSREYLHTIRLSRSEEKRLWTINYGFWTLLAQVYERVLLIPGERPEALKGLLGSLCTRLICALRGVVKWEQFHYGPTPADIWRRMGNALLVAEQAGQASRLVSLGALAGNSSPTQELHKAIVFHAASLDSLLPLEIELAERIIGHYLGLFSFSSQAVHDSVYWVDLTLAQPPLRMAQMPNGAQPTQRFFKPGAAHAAMQAVLENLERGGDIPADIGLGAQYPVRTLLPVLRHLCAYLAPVPPQRRHDRHRVKHRMSVLSGLVNTFVVFSREFGGRPAGLQIESWVVENVSRGGFGAQLSSIPGEWLKVGALLAMQPDGGENWLLGCIRRYHRDGDSEARVGIQTLARDVLAVELHLQAASSYAAVAGTPALLLRDGNAPGEIRVVLPASSFDLRERFDCQVDGCRHQLEALALLEHTADYDLARYRIFVAV